MLSKDSIPYGAAASARAARPRAVIVRTFCCSSDGPSAIQSTTDGLQEGEKRRNTESRGDDGEYKSGGVTNVPVCVVDIGPHCGDHVCETGCLGKVEDDLSSFEAGIVVFVNEQRLDDDENFVYVRPDEIIEFVQNMVNVFDEKVPFLVFERRFHEQREDLVEEGPAPKSRAFSVIFRIAVLRTGGVPFLISSRRRMILYSFISSTESLVSSSLKNAR